MHIFYVQGGGLGHLTRIDQFIRQLNIASNKVIIITPSGFTHYFKDYNFHAISWKNSSIEWTKAIITILNNQTVTTFYIDAFPLGIKGELIPVFKAFKTIEYCYISRLLKWDVYLDAMPETYQPKFHKTVVLENLYDAHYNWIIQHSQHLETLNIYEGVDYNSHQVSETIQKPYALLVHSGGPKALLKLCRLVATDSDLENIKIIVFTQVSVDFTHPLFEFRTGIYPITNYLKDAVKIYTAAGFNSMHELQPYSKKHVAIALEKLFDDQFFRLENFKNSRPI